VKFLVTIDTNHLEHVLRSITIDHKNWLFAYLKLAASLSTACKVCPPLVGCMILILANTFLT
jgi:hypothetical protein